MYTIPHDVCVCISIRIHTYFNANTHLNLFDDSVYDVHMRCCLFNLLSISILSIPLYTSRVHMFYCENLTKLLQFAIFIQTEINYSKEISIINSNSFQHILIRFFMLLLFMLSQLVFFVVVILLLQLFPSHMKLLLIVYFSLYPFPCVFIARYKNPTHEIVKL